MCRNILRAALHRNLSEGGSEDNHTRSSTSGGRGCCWCWLLSVRAKSRLRATITQTWYYHVCVILSITSVWYFILGKFLTQKKISGSVALFRIWNFHVFSEAYIIFDLFEQKKMPFQPLKKFFPHVFLKYHVSVILSRLCDTWHKNNGWGMEKKRKAIRWNSSAKFNTLFGGIISPKNIMLFRDH